MVRQKALQYIGGCILAIVLMVSVILLHRLKAASEQNVVTIGKVKIALMETEEDSPEDSDSSEQVEYVEPGQRIIKNSSIAVLEDSQPAYLRAKLIVTGLNESQKRELMETFSVETGWILNSEDGYYYYQQEVKAGEQIPFFNRMVVPERWEIINKNLMFQMDILAEAVEADKVIIDKTDAAEISDWLSYEKMSEIKSDVLNY